MRYDLYNDCDVTELQYPITLTGGTDTYTPTADIGSNQNWGGGVAILNIGDGGTDATDALDVTLQGAPESVVSTLSSTADTGVALRYATNDNIKLSYSFLTAQAYNGLYSVKLYLKKLGTPAGGTPKIWVTVESDSGGNPNGAITNGTSNVIDPTTLSTSYGWIEFTFAIEPVLATSTTYHIVLQGDYTVDASNHVLWAVDTVTSGGKMEIYDSSWADVSTQTPATQVIYRTYSTLATFSQATGADTYCKQLQYKSFGAGYRYIRGLLNLTNGNSASFPISMSLVVPKKDSSLA